jgi:hypothetical protein
VQTTTFGITNSKTTTFVNILSFNVQYNLQTTTCGIAISKNTEICVNMVSTSVFELAIPFANYYIWYCKFKTLCQRQFLNWQYPLQTTTFGIANSKQMFSTCTPCMLHPHLECKFNTVLNLHSKCGCNFIQAMCVHYILGCQCWCNNADWLWQFTQHTWVPSVPTNLICTFAKQLVCTWCVEHNCVWTCNTRLYAPQLVLHILFKNTGVVTVCKHIELCICELAIWCVATMHVLHSHTHCYVHIMTHLLFKLAIPIMVWWPGIADQHNLCPHNTLTLCVWYKVSKHQNWYS